MVMRKVENKNITAQLYIGIPAQSGRHSGASFIYPGYMSACFSFCPLHLLCPFPARAKFLDSLELLRAPQHITCCGSPHFPVHLFLHWNNCPAASLSAAFSTNLILLWGSDNILLQMNVFLLTEFQAMRIILICRPFKLYTKHSPIMLNYADITGKICFGTRNHHSVKNLSLN